MSGSRTDYLEAKMLNWMFGGTPYSPPSVMYIGLFSILPTDSDPGTELSGGGYARVPVNNDPVNWPAAEDATIKQNGVVFTFPAATSDWGGVAGIGIFDAATAGNLLYWSNIVPISVVTSDIVRILVGGITISAD